MSKVEMISLAAMRRAKTAKEIHEAIAMLPDDPNASATEQPQTLADLISALEAEKTQGG